MKGNGERLLKKKIGVVSVTCRMEEPREIFGSTLLCTGNEYSLVLKEATVCIIAIFFSSSS